MADIIIKALKSDNLAITLGYVGLEEQSLYAPIFK